MSKFKCKKTGIIYTRCKYCNEYSCFSDGKEDYCSKCVKVIHTPKGVKFERIKK